MEVKKVKSLLFAGLIGIIVILLPYGTFADEEDVEYSYGTVIKVDVSKSEITVAEYGYEIDEEIAVTYSVAPDVEFENLNALEEITTGAYIDIEYVIGKDGKKIAKFISVFDEVD